ETLERSGVDISTTVRSYLEELSWKVQSRQKVRELHRLIERNVKPSRRGFAAESIREDRDREH
ncbi:MAG: VapB-type antitoxin, partial [Nitrososphaerales archaeon]